MTGVRAADGELVLDLLPDPAAPRRAREAVTGFLAAGGLPEERIADARLLVSELVTNSLLHADVGTIRLRVAGGADAVRIEVGDPGPGLSAVPAAMPGPDGRGGRGLPLVEILSDRWGHVVGRPAAVWFEMDVAAADS